MDEMDQKRYLESLEKLKHQLIIAYISEDNGEIDRINRLIRDLRNPDLPASGAP